MSRTFRELLRGAAAYGTAQAQSLNGDLRATLLLNEYRERRAGYAERARALGLAYADALVASRTKTRLDDRAVRVERRPPGEVHTLAFFPLHSWHGQLLAPLRALGPVSHFNSLTAGMDFAACARRDPKALAGRRRACAEFLRYAEEVSRARKVDWVFTYTTGLELLGDTIDRVRAVTGAPVAGMCFDDKQSWDCGELGEQACGQVPLAPRLDLAWTSSRVACEWYLVEGGNPVYLPEGCSPPTNPASTPPDIDVSFVGQAYGFRRRFIERLRDMGLSVHVAGVGWPGGSIPEAEIPRLLERSKIALGMGGIGWSQDLKNLKGRDFDAPAAGTAAYLTSFNPELAEHFDIGREICCYSNADECLEVAQGLLADEARRKSVARAGRERCLRAHTWDHRFREILQILGIH